jgi:hypothetical protein
MLNDNYLIEVTEDFRTFQFISEGRKGKISKIVKYKQTNIQGVFNLGFGDEDLLTGVISDLVVTNNGDSAKVLLTVAETLYLFTDKYPESNILAIGSTKGRTRLYQIGISNNLELILKDFSVMGLLENGKWELFKRNITYEAFLVKRKL